MNPPALSPPSAAKQARDKQRRSQIIEAARGCALRQGFHAMPMAQLAQTAGMSVGQIYRHFPSKGAIIHALVEEIIERRVQRMHTGPEVPFTPRRLATRTPDLDARHAEDSVLMLEVTADATRDPEIAAILRAADQRSQQQLVSRMLEHQPKLSPEEAAARCEVLAVLIGGTVFRRMTNLQAAPKDLEDIYTRVLAVLLG